MLKFYAISALFFATVVSVAVAEIPVLFRWSGVALLILVYSAIIIWASAKIHSQVFIKTFCRNRKKTNQVALTFDDGPDTVNTPQLLSLLDEFNARATFFLIGEKIEANTSLIKKMYLHGHSVGNHSFSHRNSFPMTLPKQITADVQKTQDLLQQIVGKRNVLFRPPFGVTNPMIARGIRTLGLVSVGWNIRSLDTVKSKEETVSRVLKKIKGGDVVLLHDTTKDIVWITRQILQYLKDNDLQPVTVHELLSKNSCS